MSAPPSRYSAPADRACAASETTGLARCGRHGPSGASAWNKRYFIRARAAGHAERDQHPPSPVVLPQRRVAGIDAVYRDGFERPLVRELARAPNLHAPSRAGLRHHEPLAPPLEQRGIRQVIRAGEHRSRLADAVRAEFGAGDCALAFAVRVLLEKHECAAVMLGEERIGVEAVRRRIHDRERILRPTAPEREHPLLRRGC